MVIKKDKILTKFGNIVKLKNRLNCKNYGIYGAECKLCNELYIGQTKNRFSTRWNSHRSKWKNLCKLKLIDKQENNRNSDEAALWCHYRKFHKNIILENLDLADAFGVFFIEEPKLHVLDSRENFWISKLMASINTVHPR